MAVIFCGTKGLLSNVPIEKIADFQQAFLQLLHAKYQTDVLDELKAGKLTDDVAAKLTEAAAEVAQRY